MSKKYDDLFENEYNWLLKKVEKLNKRSIKIGCDEMSVNILKKENKLFHFDPMTDRKYVIPVEFTMYDVEVIGDTPKYEGWEFLATVVGYPNGKNMLKRNPFSDMEIDITKYRTEESHCDHCKTNRFRKFTYLVYNKSEDKIYRVGSTCIRDFLGHDIGNVFGGFAKMLGDIEDMDFSNAGPKPIPMYSLDGFLPILCETISQFGFTSKKAAYEYDKIATAGLICNILDGMNGNKYFKEYRYFKASDESKELAEKIIEWGKSLSSRENLSDYLYSISLVFENNAFDNRSHGLVCSVVFAYKNEMGQIEKNKNKKIDKNPSIFLGELKQRTDFTVKLIKVLEFDNDWGVTHMHIFEDLDNNNIVWYGSKRLEIVTKGKDGNISFNDYITVEEGETVIITGTVKAHKEYKGENQTIITRVKCKEIL